jgi:hypothetical protein
LRITLKSSIHAGFEDYSGTTQEAMRRIKQLEGALGRKTLENEILKEAVDFAKSKKWIARLTCPLPAVPKFKTRSCRSGLEQLRGDQRQTYDDQNR